MAFTRKHSRSNTYTSIFVRWDETRPTCALFEKNAQKSGVVNFNHATHKPYTCGTVIAQ